MNMLMTAVLMAAVSGSARGQTLEQAVQSGAWLTKTARTQGAVMTARGSAPCTPEAGYAWCFAPSREAALAALAKGARGMVSDGLEIQIGLLLVGMANVANEKNDRFLKKELKEMGAAVRGLQGEALLKTFISEGSKPTVTFVKDEVSYEFNVYLDARVGSRAAFLNRPTLTHLARKHNIFCSERISLILWADKAGRPRADRPLQIDDIGCVAE